MFFRKLHAKLDAILATLERSSKEQKIMSQELDALKAQVRQNTNVVQSARDLIRGLADRINANAEDPVALRALADELKASDDALAGDVAANTPADPNAPPAPTP